MKKQWSKVNFFFKKTLGYQNVLPLDIKILVNSKKSNDFAQYYSPVDERFKELIFWDADDISRRKMVGKLHFTQN